MEFLLIWGSSPWGGWMGLWMFGGVPYTHMQAHTCEHMHVCIHVKYYNFTWKWLLPWGKPWGNTYDVTHMYVHVYVCA